MAKYITDEAKKMIGAETEPVTLDVERGDIRLFAQAIGDPNPLFNDEQEARKTRFGGMIGSPTFPRLLMGRQLPKLEFPNPPKRLLDAGSEWEFFHPIRPGDRWQNRNRRDSVGIDLRTKPTVPWPTPARARVPCRRSAGRCGH